jgi:hypothetical protein
VDEKRMARIRNRLSVEQRCVWLVLAIGCQDRRTGIDRISPGQEPLDNSTGWDSPARSSS